MSKFLQKIWNLNQIIVNRTDVKIVPETQKEFEEKIQVFVFKIDNSINNFQFNVAIAQFYEVYRYINDSIKDNISNTVIKNNLIMIMKLMIPFTPHLAYECLESLKCKNMNMWPKINKNVMDNIQVNIVMQINGKTRDVLNVPQNLSEKEVDQLFKKTAKGQKYFLGKKIKKTIFVKNKIINYIIAD